MPSKNSSSSSSRAAWVRGNQALPLVAASLLGAACPAPQQVARPYAPPTAEELAQHLRARAAKIRTLRTEAKVDYLAGHAERVKVSMEFVVAAPDKVRIDADSPVGGGTLASLASDGKEVQLLDARENRFLAGPADACAMARLLRVGLSPADLVQVVSGGAPLLGEPRSVDWSPEAGGREVLTVALPSGGSERIALSAPNKSWDVVAVDVTGPDGKPIYKLTHDGFAPLEGSPDLRVPSESHIEEPARSGDARIRYRTRELNADVPPATFHLTPPPGLPTESLACP